MDLQLLGFMMRLTFARSTIIEVQVLPEWLGNAKRPEMPKPPYKLMLMQEIILRVANILSMGESIKSHLVNQVRLSQQSGDASLRLCTVQTTSLQGGSLRDSIYH